MKTKETISAFRPIYYNDGTYLFENWSDRDLELARSSYDVDLGREKDELMAAELKRRIRHIGFELAWRSGITAPIMAEAQ